MSHSRSFAKSALAALAVSIFVHPAMAQADQATIGRIIEYGKAHTQVVPLLKYICFECGARLTGSPSLQKTEDWAVARFKSWGLSNVHLEQWGEVSVGFVRGKTQVARMVAPEKRTFEFSCNAWTNGTIGAVRGPAMYAPTTMADFDKVKGILKGAWLIEKGDFYMPTRGKEPEDVRDAIDAAGIAGRVFGSGNELVHTDGRWGKKTAMVHPGAVGVVIRKSDMKAVQALLDAGKTPTLEFNIDNEWVPGPVPVYNVVADIPGTEKADEMVIIGGHIDSWDGPGSQGASDNGTGVVTAMEAARILMAVGAHPKRTIRFVLWSGEEQGLYGSQGYCKLHEGELPKVSAVLVDDGGSDYQAGYTGPKTYEAIMEAAFAPVALAFPEYPEQYRVVKAMHNQEQGSDHASFWRYGVPGFFTIEKGGQNYGRIHHTQFDRYEEVIPPYLVQSAINHAVVAYTLADIGVLLPRVPPRNAGG